MIKIESLTKVYKKGDQVVRAIDGIDLQIHKGDIYGIIGLSGAGKSSLVRCINRIEDPTSGTIIVDGTDILSLKGKALRQARQKIGMIFQNFNLLSSKTVYENIAFPLKLQKLDKAVIHERVMELLEKVELSDKANAYPINLSGGQKQRVGIARALANAPEILLCDEATSALDPKTTKQILELLKKINTEMGVTLVVITHEMEVIKEVCNKVAILEAGKVIEQGDTIDVFTREVSEETRHFIGEVEIPNTLPSNGCRIALTFTEGSAKFPILSRLVRKYDLDINILSGTIESIQDQPVGRLLIEIIEPPTDINHPRSESYEITLQKILDELHAEMVSTRVIPQEALKGSTRVIPQEVFTC